MSTAIAARHSLSPRLRRYWGMIKLEFRQHRGGFIYAPMIVVGLLVLMMALAAITGEAKININGQDLIPKGLAKIAVSPEFAQYRSSVLTGPFLAVAGLFHLVLSVVLVSFFLGSLFDERKDRSILFWKSLPVGDTETVLIRLGTALLLAPLAYLVAIFGAYILVLLFTSYVVWRLDASPLELVWSAAQPLSLTLKFLLIQWLGMLWLLPVYAWLMLCSAFAKARPILWAILVPGAVYLFASWLRWTASVNVGIDAVISDLGNRIGGFVFPFSPRYAVSQGMDKNGQFMPPQDLLIGPALDKLSEPSLWIGVAFAAAMIYLSIHLRRNRDDAL